jgi:hexokinase
MLLSTLRSQVVSWHTTTHKREGVPYATEDDLDEQFKKYEKLFALSPDRLKEITKSFVEVLKAGLQKEGQTVVSRQSG